VAPVLFLVFAIGTIGTLTTMMSVVGLGGLAFVYYRLRLTSKARAAAAARTRGILETALDAIVSMDHEGKIVEFNPAAETMFGYPRAEMLQRKLADVLVPPTLREAHKRGVAHFLATGEGPILGKRIETTARRADDSSFPVELTVNIIQHRGPPTFTAYLRDLTDSKRVHEELAERTRHLEEKNTSLKQEISDRIRAEQQLETVHRQLVAARRTAEASSRAKSEFLANMSHEIRTPMTAILGYADLLMEDGDLTRAPEDRIEAISTIQRNGAHLLQIINDILDLSKIEAGKMTVESQVCSPIQLLSDVDSLMRVRADAKRLALEFDCEGELPESIHSDPTRLRQILVNLVGNAVKFTERGTVRVVTRLVRGERPRLEFDVVDSGIGMTGEQTQRLFQAFAQGDASTTRNFGGTGLGLVISKRLAEMLGGNVTVIKTEPGLGTTFRLTLAIGSLANVPMIATQGAMSTFVKNQGPAIQSASVAQLPGRRILLAEDGVDNQRLIAFVLRRVGAEIITVENGQLAVDAALAADDQGHPFDLILMDMQMPVMDGYQAVALLRAKAYGGPIIALTAHAMAGDRERCLRAGCDDYATKPIDRAQLLETIAAWASRSPPAIAETVDQV
jgi:PAS domain S-box-containing protein